MKRIMFCMLMACMSIFVATPVLANNDVTVITWDGPESASDNSSNTASEKQNNENSSSAMIMNSKSYLALGADLTPEQQATVLQLMGLGGADLSTLNVVYVTNADERAYLGEYVDSSVLGTKALSSVLVTPAEKGHGVVVNTKNINYCTEGMYRNALLTAGVEDADILVVAPTSISGTSALIGALKAYAEMTGDSVNQESLDTALSELVTTGEIADKVGDNEEVEKLIAFIKAEIAGKDLNTEAEIEEAVRKAVKDYGADLTEEEIQQIISLMLKIKELGLDYDTLLDQAADLYAKFGDDISLDDLGSLSKETKVEMAKYAVGKFFTNVFEGITNFFKSIFG